MSKLNNGDPCWIWKDGYLLHDYIELQNNRVALTKQLKAVRLHQEIFSTYTDAIQWMKDSIHKMETYNPCKKIL